MRRNAARGVHGKRLRKQEFKRLMDICGPVSCINKHWLD